MSIQLFFLAYEIVQCSVIVMNHTRTISFEGKFSKWYHVTYNKAIQDLFEIEGGGSFHGLGYSKLGGEGGGNLL